MFTCMYRRQRFSLFMFQLWQTDWSTPYPTLMLSDSQYKEQSGGRLFKLMFISPMSSEYTVERVQNVLPFFLVIFCLHLYCILCSFSLYFNKYCSKLSIFVECIYFSNSSPQFMYITIIIINYLHCPK